MTEQELLECSDPVLMLEFIGGTASERKLRLFGVACCRRLWSYLKDKRSRRFVEVVELFADGGATAKKLAAAFDRSEQGWEAIHWSNGSTVEQKSASAVLSLGKELNMIDLVEELSEAAGEVTRDEAYERVWNTPGKDHWTKQTEDEAAWRAGDTAEKEAQSALLRDVIGFPTTLITQVPFIPTVIALAQAAYDNRDLPSGCLDSDRLAVLSDALEEAGCDNAEILNHLRGPGPHVRGCWPIDLILGKS